MKLPEKLYFVYSGKGGVGKSTICTNLAYSLAQRDVRVGLFDADLCGPSLPTLVKGIMSVQSAYNCKGFCLKPEMVGNVYVSSIGYVSECSEGGYWQGKYLEGMLFQLLFGAHWPELDALFIDMPPGVGEVHQILFKNLNGKALIITTPQKLSYTDTIRAIEMLERMNIDIIGVVENMSYYKCRGCGVVESIYAGNTRETLCKPLGLKLLAQLPINSTVNVNSEKGVPFVLDSTGDQEIVSELRMLSEEMYHNYTKFKTIRPTN